MVATVREKRWREEMCQQDRGLRCSERLVAWQVIKRPSLQYDNEMAGMRHGRELGMGGATQGPAAFQGCQSVYTICAGGGRILMALVR